MIHSPLNYTGGKCRLLPQLLPLLPPGIGTFVDLFCGGLNVAVNVDARRKCANDAMLQLIHLYRWMQNHAAGELIRLIRKEISQRGLDDRNEAAYLELREEYNSLNRERERERERACCCSC